MHDCRAASADALRDVLHFHCRTLQHSFAAPPPLMCCVMARPPRPRPTGAGKDRLTLLVNWWTYQPMEPNTRTLSTKVVKQWGLLG